MCTCEQLGFVHEVSERSSTDSSSSSVEGSKSSGQGVGGSMSANQVSGVVAVGVAPRVVEVGVALIGFVVVESLGECIGNGLAEVLE